MEARIREVHGQYYAESGDEGATFHQCPLRETLEQAKQDALEAYSTRDEEWSEPVECDPDIILVAVQPPRYFARDYTGREAWCRSIADLKIAEEQDLKSPVDVWAGESLDWTRPDYIRRPLASGEQAEWDR